MIFLKIFIMGIKYWSTNNYFKQLYTRALSYCIPKHCIPATFTCWFMGPAPSGVSTFLSSFGQSSQAVSLPVSALENFLLNSKIDCLRESKFGNPTILDCYSKLLCTSFVRRFYTDITDILQIFSVRFPQYQSSNF